MSECFVYHWLDEDFPTTINIAGWIERDPRLREFRDKLALETCDEDARWYSGFLFVTALGDRLDSYLITQSKNIAVLREGLNLSGALCELVIRSPGIDPKVMNSLAAIFARLGSGWTAPTIGSDRTMSRLDQVRAAMAVVADGATKNLKFTINAPQIYCSALTHDDYLLPPPSEGDPIENPARLAVLEAWAKDTLADMRDGYLRRMENDESFIRMIIGERVVKRFPEWSERAIAAYQSRTKKLADLLAQADASEDDETDGDDDSADSPP